jgi:hypothetical protein
MLKSFPNQLISTRVLTRGHKIADTNPEAERRVIDCDLDWAWREAAETPVSSTCRLASCQILAEKKDI